MTRKVTRRAVIQRLESLGRAGVTHVKRVPKQASTPLETGIRSGPVAQPPSAVPRGAGKAESGCATSKGPTDPRSAALAEVARDVAACTRCAELARTRTQTVFGVGNPYARLVFCGEAPGADEDRLGEPFVGRAGQLLTDIIVKGMKMRREDVYILNILRCRPPANRTPLPIEAANCREYLDRQLAIIQPEFICLPGGRGGAKPLGNRSVDRTAPRPGPRLSRRQGRLHLPPRLSLAKPRRQTVRLGRH